MSPHGPHVSIKVVLESFTFRPPHRPLLVDVEVAATIDGEIYLYIGGPPSEVDAYLEELGNEALKHDLEVTAQYVDAKSLWF